LKLTSNERICDPQEEEIKFLRVGIPPIIESKSTKFKSFNTKIKKMKKKSIPFTKAYTIHIQDASYVHHWHPPNLAHKHHRFPNNEE
jgi:hypothetical protein